MFTSYIKNLNDMVFSTSEAPEEQPTGVFGYIGSWFSPWRVRSPRSSTESTSPTSDNVFKSEGEEESEIPGKAEESGEEKQEESLQISKDILLCEGKDATQSAHRDGSVVSSTEATGAGGDPDEEESAGRRKKRTGQGKESSNGASESGNPEKNASHLTHLSSSFEQGVLEESDPAPRQVQAQTGKRLHVYLEETSVICGKDAGAGQEVITKVKTSLQVLQRARSTESFDSLQSKENKRTNVKPAFGAQSYYSALVGVSLKSHKGSQSEPELNQIQTEEDDSMGRKNAARRRSRKNSQGDGGSSPSQQKMPPNAVSEGIPTPDNTVTSPQGRSPSTHTGQTSANSSSSSKKSPSSQASPEGGKDKAPVTQLDDFQDPDSTVTAATVKSAMDGGAEMEEDDSLYKVERKTETPESKRRSIKVSRSEVKFFPKSVPLNSQPSPAGNTQEFTSTLRTSKEEAKDTAKTETDSRRQNLKKIDEEPKPVIGRIADKISLFERPAGGVNKLTSSTPRSADVSPVRKATDKLKEDSLSLTKRARSAERYDMARSTSASPSREKPMTIKERMKNYEEASKAGERTTLPTKPAMTRMPPKPTPKPLKLDHQGKQDGREQKQTEVKAEIASKPDGQDTIDAGVKISTGEQPQTDSKTAEQGAKPGDLSPQTKGRTRPKRRKSKEPASPMSPLSPNSESKFECATTEQEVTAVQQGQVDDTKSVRASEQLTDEALPACDNSNKTMPDKEYLSDAAQKEFKSDLKETKSSDFSFQKEENKLKRQGGLAEPSVSNKEPDTSACSTETKTPIDKEAVILPKQEEEKGGLTNEEGEKAANDSSKMSASSSLLPAPEKPIEKEPPVEHPKLNKELRVQPEPKSEGKAKEAKKEGVQKDESKSKEAEIIKQPDKKDVGSLEKVDSKNAKQAVNTEKLEKVNSGITKQVESKEVEKVENQARSKDKAEQNATKIEISDTGQCPSGTDVAAVTKDIIKAVESKEEVLLNQDATEPEKDKQKQATEPSVKTTSDTSAQTQHEKQNKSTHPQKADTHANEGIKNNKGPSKEETTTEGREKETEPPLTMKPKSVSVEKSENSLDDSCAHGANDATLPSPMPITGAATADENVTVKASDDTTGLITAEPGDMAETEAKDKNPNPITVSESVSSERERKEFKIAPQEVKISGEESKNTESTRDIMEKNAHMSSDSTASKSAAHVAERTDEKKIQTPRTELTPVVNGKISTHPEPSTFKKETSDSKFSQSPKASVSQEAKEPAQDSTQRSPMKKLLLPRGRSKDDSVSMEDAPSSWLDVDLPKRRLKVSVPKLTSAGSESNLLDTPDDLDDNDFVERIRKLCAPFSLPPRRHNPFGPPQPPFAMPAIKEDRFEKTFDPEEFQFGLRKKKQFSIDTTPSILAKIQNAEEKPSLKLTRASLADRSMLLSSLDTHSRLRDKTPNNENENAKEEKDDLIKRKSRLEGSCVLSSLTSSILRGKRTGLQTQAESTNSGDVSPSDSPQSSPPPTWQTPPSSPTAPAPLKDTLAKQSPAPTNKEEAQAGEAVVSESAPPLPSFNDIKLPDYLEKYLPREAKPAQSKQGQEQNRTECLDQANGKMTTPVSADEADMGVKSVLPEAVPAAPRFPGVPPPAHYKLPELKQPPAQPQGILHNFARTPKGFHRRPGKMVLFEKAQFSGQAFEIYRDLADATSLQLSPLISVKVVRGCWVLYEKPDFQGRCIALEEGGMELTNVWAEPEPETEPQNNPPMLIGSIRLAVWDYSLPHIDLFTEPEGRGRVTPYHDDTIETGSFGIPLNTASIQVHSGVWLVFSDPGFQGMVSVLERGVYPFPETWGFPSPFVGSIRPLKIGGFKVENPNEVKAIVFEKPGFEGSCLEFDSEVFSFCESEGEADKIKTVGSLKIIGGLWVGYSHPGFEGQQFILEEGEYIDCSEWGGSEQLLSLRPVLADFMTPHLKMFSDKDFGDHGVNIDVTVPIFNMDETGYGMKTQSIDVISGVWVVFEEPGFCSESYILEKGLYGNPEDWGALQPRVGSAMPVILDDFEIAAKFKVQLFSDPGFQGTILTLEDSVASLQASFSVASCKVLAGSWLAFEGQDFSGRMYVLEVGNYPDLRSMGCFNTNSSILSLQITGFEFSLPSITVFERVGLRGKRVVLTEGSVNLQLAGGCSRVQSVLVEGGMWVAYEEINYRGAQILLKPNEIHDWQQICSWRKIGSLRPLMQKQVHFRIRNRQTQLMMTLTGALDDVKLMRVQETEETGEFDQIWFYQNGHLHCKLLEECCLSPSGSVTMAGSRVGITPEPNQVHLWSITPEGFIRYSPTPDLVLEVKGGHNYDKNQVILNTLDPHKLNQRWDVEIL